MKEIPVQARRKYDATFKGAAVQNWVSSGKSAAVIGHELGIAANRLYAWRSEFGPSAALPPAAEGPKPGSTADLQAHAGSQTAQHNAFELRRPSRLGAIAFILFQSCRPTVDCWVFRERNQSYYSAIGDECDTLLKQYEGQTPVKMSGQDIHGLPSLLKDLSPSFIVIQSNSVMVLMGGGSGGCQILWKEDQFNNSIWLLIINREGQESRVLFSKTKPRP